MPSSAKKNSSTIGRGDALKAMAAMIGRRESIPESLTPTSTTSSCSPRSSNTPTHPRDHQRKRFYKTRLCPYHFKKGSSCKGGELCSYAHSFQELRPSVDLTKTKLCVDFINGACLRVADECPFAHGDIDIRPAIALTMPDIDNLKSVADECGLLSLSPLAAPGNLYGYDQQEFPVVVPATSPSSSREDSCFFQGASPYNDLAPPSFLPSPPSSDTVKFLDSSSSLSGNGPVYEPVPAAPALNAEDEARVEISLTQLANIITAARLGRDLSSMVARVLQQGVPPSRQAGADARRGRTY